jgi:hypothetical protein
MNKEQQASLKEPTLIWKAEESDLNIENNDH